MKWFSHAVLSGGYQLNNYHQLIALAVGSSWTVNVYDGYMVNGYRLHTERHGRTKGTMNSGVCVRAGTSSTPGETDYYRMLQEVIKLSFGGCSHVLRVVLFNCDWYQVGQSEKWVHPSYGLVEINPRSKLNIDETFILANQATQVYYTSFPSRPYRHPRRNWWAVCSIRARHVVDFSSMPEVIEENDATDRNSFQNFQDDTPPTTATAANLQVTNEHIPLIDDTFTEVEDIENSYMPIVNDDEGYQSWEDTEEEDEAFDYATSEDSSDSE